MFTIHQDRQLVQLFDSWKENTNYIVTDRFNNTYNQYRRERGWNEWDIQEYIFQKRGNSIWLNNQQVLQDYTSQENLSLALSFALGLAFHLSFPFGALATALSLSLASSIKEQGQSDPDISADTGLWDQIQEALRGIQGQSNGFYQEDVSGYICKDKVSLRLDNLSTDQAAMILQMLRK